MNAILMYFFKNVPGLAPAFRFAFRVYADGLGLGFKFR